MSEGFNSMQERLPRDW